MHYVDEGSGVPILLCHGNPTWSFLYRDIIKALRGRFRCIAPDYLGLDGYRSMGQDWGGPVSMAVDTARAERVRGVVLGNAWFWPVDYPAMKVLDPLLGGLVQRLILRRNVFVEWLIPRATAASLDDAVMDHYRGVQPCPAARVGVAKMPDEILGAEALLNGWPGTFRRGWDPNRHCWCGA